MARGTSSDDAGNSGLRVAVLGPLAVDIGGRPVAIGGAKPRAVLAAFVANANKPVSAGRLAAEIYDGAHVADPVATIRVHVSNLRSVFDRAGLARTTLITSHGGYILHLTASQTDAGAFDSRWRAARVEADPALALDLVEQALGLWRGEPYEDVTAIPLVQPEVLRLSEAVRSTHAHRIELLLALGRHHVAVSELEGLVAQHPTDETLRGLLMLTLYRSGRQTDALRCGQEVRQLLRCEFGAEPGPALRRLENAILNQDPALGAPAPFGSSRTSSIDARRDTSGGAIPTAPASRLPVTARAEAAGDDDHHSDGADDRPDEADDAVRCYRQLPGDVRAVLAVAAVLGDRFSPTDLARVLAADPAWHASSLGRERASNSFGLAQAVTAGLLVVDPEDPALYRFSDRSTRDAIYGDVDIYTRARLHGGCALAFEESEAMTDLAAITRLAEHGERAMAAGVVTDRVVGWLRSAGEQAQAHGRHAEAEAWFSRALRAADRTAPESDDQRTGLLLMLGNAHWRAGHAADARRTFLDVLHGARRTGDARVMSRAVLGFADDQFPRDRLAFVSRSSQSLCILVEEALRALGDADLALHARLLGLLAVVRASAGAATEAADLSQQAVDLADGVGDRRELGLVLAWRSIALTAPDNLLLREDSVRRLLALAAEVGDDHLLHVALRHSVHCLVDRDRLEDARAVMGRLRGIAAGLGEPVADRHMVMLETMFALLDGRWRDAERLAGAGLAAGRMTEDPDFAVLEHAIQMSVVHYNRHDTRELEGIIELLLANVEGTPEAGSPDDARGTTWRTWLPAVCLFEWWVGRRERSVERLRWMVGENPDPVPNDEVRLCNLAMLAVVATEAVIPEVAAVLLELLRPYAGRRVNIPGLLTLAPVSYYMGGLGLVASRYQEAELWLRRSVDQCARPGASPYQATWSLSRLGKLLERRGDDADRAEAERISVDVSAAANRLGVRAVLRGGP